MRRLIAAALPLALAAALVLPADAAAQTPMKHSATIVETAEAAGSFNTLLAALKATGLDATLNTAGPFTVFAPTDAAFAKLPAGTVEALLKDKEKLSAILTYHVVAGKVPASQVVTLNRAKTVNGQSVTITQKDGKVMVDGATVTATDVMASNGLIHVIDAVILPKQ